MKKLFFTVLVVTVAIGGTLSANAINIYSLPVFDPVFYVCDEISLPTCLDYVPWRNGPIYSDVYRTVLINTEDLGDLQFVP